MMNAETIIEILNLQPLPTEGGYFGVTFTADDIVSHSALPERYTSDRTLGGAIYFLETPEQFSAMHMLPTDEIYHHHLGDPVEMLFLGQDGSGRTAMLGSDLTAGHRPQVLAPRNHWHGSRPLPGGEHGFSLMSTTMAPGFDISDPVYGSREDLVRQYPEFSSLIEDLTRLGPHNI